MKPAITETSPATPIQGASSEEATMLEVGVEEATRPSDDAAL